MPFPQKLLNDGEEIVLDLRPHWWRLVMPVAVFVVAVVLAILIEGGLDVPALSYGGFGLCAIAFAWLVVRYLKWASTSFVVTTHRLIYRYGVVAKHGRELPLDRLNDIT